MHINHESMLELLPPMGRHAYFTPEKIKELVHLMKPGLSCPANLEKHKTKEWRLRLTLNNPSGGVVRRGITMPDRETALWVQDYLTRIRLERTKERGEGKDDRGG